MDVTISLNKTEITVLSLYANNNNKIRKATTIEKKVIKALGKRLNENNT